MEMCSLSLEKKRFTHANPMFPAQCFWTKRAKHLLWALVHFEYLVGFVNICNKFKQLTLNVLICSQLFMHLHPQQFSTLYFLQNPNFKHHSLIWTISRSTIDAQRLIMNLCQLVATKNNLSTSKAPRFSSNFKTIKRLTIEHFSISYG